MSGRLPSLSVSVIQFTGPSHLGRCLDALVTQPDVAEILVPHDDTLDDVAQLGARYPRVRFLPMTGRRTPAELRATAAKEASGDVIAFLEDHCVPAEDWAAAFLHAHGASHGAIGGAVDKGFLPGRSDDTHLNWAIYFTDYSRYMNPQPGGPARSLTDCNVSYKRTALEPIRAAWATEFHENIVNGQLVARGETLWLEPRVLVHEQRTLTLRGALRDRYAFGRLYASTRVAGVPLHRRLAFAAGALALPPVLVLRVARNVLGRRRHRGPFGRSLPWLFLVTGTWMWGECVGYISGRAVPGLQPGAASEHAPGRALADRAGAR